MKQVLPRLRNPAILTLQYLRLSDRLMRFRSLSSRSLFESDEFSALHNPKQSNQSKINNEIGTSSTLVTHSEKSA
jgi:hypothetical protein